MTIDKSRPSPENRPALPAFVPVPRHYKRHDGWTPERQRAFIEALADTGSVKAAAHAVNMTPEGAYLLRRHPEAGEFRAAWEAALSHGVQRLEDAGLERALNGVEVPVYHFGAVVGTRTVYDNRLLMFYLRNRLGQRFNADARNPDLDPASLRRKLEKEWRADWERRQAIEDAAREDEVIESIDRKLGLMHRRSLASQSPATRALFAQAKASHAADQAAGYFALDDEADGHDEGAEGEDEPGSASSHGW